MLVLRTPLPDPVYVHLRRQHYRAGQSALTIWRTRRRQTIRHDWRPWTYLLLASCGFATALFFTNGVEQLAFAAMLGSMLTVIYVGWQLGGDVRSLTWIWGQGGEQQTEDVLRPLESDGWRVIHDIPNGHGNWDHVVVGSGGLFLLDTKSSARTALVKDDRLYLGRSTYSGGAFRGSAKSLHTALAAYRPPYAQAVVVIWADFRAKRQEERGVIYVAGGELANWLSSLPPKLAEPRVDELGGAIESLRSRTV